MVSIVPYKNNLISNLTNNNRLPSEIVSLICKIGDIMSYFVVVNEKKWFSINDINTKKEIKRFYMKPLDNIMKMSVSKCGKYIVGSDETRVCIYYLNTFELIKTINVDFDPIYDEERDGGFRFFGSESNGEPEHTFTVNNELLVTCNNQIKTYNLDINLQWVEKNIYQIPNESKIVKITANQGNNMFACGDLNGDIYIFNDDTQELLHEITTRKLLIRSDHFPEITSIAFNQNIIVVSSVGRNNIVVDLNTMNKQKIEEPSMDYPGSYFSIKNYLLTPCNKMFIGTFNNYTFIWDVNSGKVIKKLDVNIENNDNCMFTPDGNKLVSYGWRTDLQVFDKIW